MAPSTMHNNVKKKFSWFTHRDKHNIFWILFLNSHTTTITTKNAAIRKNISLNDKLSSIKIEFSATFLPLSLFILKKSKEKAMSREISSSESSQKII